MAASTFVLLSAICAVRTSGLAVVSMENSKSENLFVGDFSNSAVLHSNLGGNGPDDGAETLHIRDVAGMESGVNLVITVDDSAAYSPNDSKENGLSYAFGLINVKCGSTARLRFHFVDALTNQRRQFSQIPFTMYDFDRTENGANEVATIEGASSYWATSTTELISDITSDGGSWMSSTVGDSDDNPKDHAFTQQQRDRSVTFLFEHTSTFIVTFAVQPSSAGCSGVGGRTFLYDFNNSNSAETQITPKGWSSSKITRPELSYTWKDAFVARNNLGDTGPDIDGLRGILIKKVGIVGGEQIDLSVTVNGGTYVPNNPAENGMRGGWGIINGKCGSSVDLRFTFLSSFEGTAVRLPLVFFSFGGLDAGIDGNCIMSITSKKYNKYYLSEDTELVTTSTENGTMFSGTVHGEGLDPNMKDAVAYRFYNVNEIFATVTWGEGGVGGRNLYFNAGREISF